MRTDKKSEFLKTLKRDKVKEEHEDENHDEQEKVILFVLSIGPVDFRQTIIYIYFAINSC